MTLTPVEFDRQMTSCTFISVQSSFVGAQYKYKLASHPRRLTNQYGVKETEVDQSCFNDLVKWIKARVSELCHRRGVRRGDSRLWGILQIRTRLSGNSEC